MTRIKEAGGPATAEEIHNSGETRVSDQRAAALVGRLFIEAVQENDSFFQSKGELALRTAVSMQAELEETYRSVGSFIISQYEGVQRAVADVVQKVVEALPPSNPMVGAAYDGWKALSEGNVEPMDRFLEEYLKLPATSENRKLLWNIIDASMNRPVPNRSGQWLVLGPKWAKALTNEMHRRIRLYSEIKAALLDYDTSSTSQQRKHEELPGATYTAWNAIQQPGHSSTLVDTVSNNLRNLAPGVGAVKLAKDGKLANESIEPGAEDELLEQFELREEVHQQIDMHRMLVEKASFSEQEERVYEFDSRVGTDFAEKSDATKAAAHELGIKPATVRVVRKRYQDKLREARKAAES